MKGLYRGKRKDNGEWVYGAYIVMHHNDGRTHLHHFIIPDDSDLSFGVKVEDILVEVIPETVGQYVRWTDKGGTQIFEDDICVVRCGMMYGQTHEAMGVICYSNMGMLSLKRKDGVYDDFFFCVSVGSPDWYEIEVVSNIHDNPELLEAK